MRVEWAGCVAMAVAITACGEDEPGLDCNRVVFETCDIRGDACQRRVFDQMRCLRGDEDVTARPRVVVVSQDELREEFEAAAVEVEVNADQMHAYEALALLGLIATEDIDPDAQVELRLDGLLGFYSHDSRQIVVVDSGQRLDGEEAVTTLGHEYVHALQDIEFDLRAYREGVSTSVDAVLASTSVVEGEAMLYDQFQLASLRAVDPFRQDWPKLFEVATDYADSMGSPLPSPLLVAGAFFPYTYGGHTSAVAWDDGGQDEVVRRRNVDLFTQGYLARRHTSAIAEVPNLAQLSAEEAINENVEDRRTLGSDSLGAWLLHTFLVQVLGHPTEPDMALGWRGDVLSLFVNEASGSVELVWMIEWSSAAEAGAFTDEALLSMPPVDGAWTTFSDGARSGLIASSDPEGVPDDLVAAAGGTPVDDGEMMATAESEPEALNLSTSKSALRALLQRVHGCVH